MIGEIGDISINEFLWVAVATMHDMSLWVACIFFGILMGFKRGEKRGEMRRNEEKERIFF